MTIITASICLQLGMILAQQTSIKPCKHSMLPPPSRLPSNGILRTLARAQTQTGLFLTFGLTEMSACETPAPIRQRNDSTDGELTIKAHLLLFSSQRSFRKLPHSRFFLHCKWSRNSLRAMSISAKWSSYTTGRLLNKTDWHKTIVCLHNTKNPQKL